MELYHLRTFVAVADAGHLTRAAQRLCLSQPTVSAHIKGLEDILGLTLFERTPRGMVLNDAGRALLSDVRGALAAAEQVRAHARRIRGELHGVLRVGMNTDAEFLRLPQLQHALASLHPHLGLELLAGSTGANLAKLDAGQLDASFVSGAVDASRHDHLFLRDEEMAIVVPALWYERLAHADLVTLAQQPWIHNAPDHIQTRVLEAVFAPTGLQPMRAAVINRKDSILAMVAAQTGLAISRRADIERTAQDRAICALPLRLPPVPVSFVWPAGARDPALSALLDALRSVWPRPA